MADNPSIFVCRLSRNPGSLNLLEPSAPVQACIGIALPYLFSYIISLLKWSMCCTDPTISYVRHFVLTFAIRFLRLPSGSYVRHSVLTFAILFLRSPFCSYVWHFALTLAILFLRLSFCSYVRHFVLTSAILYLRSPFCSYVRHFIIIGCHTQDMAIL
jgi:hypothetical protein